MTAAQKSQLTTHSDEGLPFRVFTDAISRFVLISAGLKTRGYSPFGLRVFADAFEPVNDERTHNSLLATHCSLVFRLKDGNINSRGLLSLRLLSACKSKMSAFEP